jgi:DinB superfamily
MIEPLALIFKLNNGLVGRSLDGLSDDDVWTRLAGTGNPIAWLVGHLAEARGRLLAELGVAADPGWGGAFARGSAVGGRERYPSRAAIEAAWKATHGAMRDAFAALDQGRLSHPPTRHAFPGVATLADEIGGFAFHESYHVGQIGFIRKQLGHSSVAG